MIVCVCNNVSDGQVKAAIHNGMKDLSSLRDHLAIGSDCGKCKSCTKKILKECTQPSDSAHAQIHTLRFQGFQAA